MRNVRLMLAVLFFYASAYGHDQTRSWNLSKVEERQAAAHDVRVSAADERSETTVVAQNDNGEEALYADKRASFTKGLPHSGTGFVNLSAYQTLIDAINSGDAVDFDAITMGGDRGLVNPQAACAFSLIGADAGCYEIPPAPTITSAEAAGEMVELYWKVLARDVRFSDYDTSAIIGMAVADMNSLSDFKGPRDGGLVTRGTLFRGPTPGDLTGPYISQFLYLPVPYRKNISQKRETPKVNAGNDFMTSFSDWLSIQNGDNPAKNIAFRTKNRYIRTGRDLGDWVHNDFPGEPFFNAALILLGMGKSALDDNNPYKNNATQVGFVTYGVSDILTMIMQATNAALKAAWHQKWNIHRRLRPEVFGYLVHHQVTSIGVDYNLHSDLLNSTALTQTFAEQANYFLAQQYPEGSPTHPSYPAGHATISGACATILKAFFNEDFVIQDPVVPSANGKNLVAYVGDTLTILSEVNKLASNISLGRDFAGVHYRSDGIEGMLLGEKVAIDLLEDIAFTINENFEGFSLTKFDGTKITVGAKKAI